MAEIMLQTTASITKKRQNIKTQTLLFSATMTQSLQQIQSLTSSSSSSATPSLPWKWIQINEDTQCQTHHDGNRTEVAQVLSTHPGDEDSNHHRETIQDAMPRIPSGLAQEYIFMPSRVREAYLVTAIRKLVRNGGRKRNIKDVSEKNDVDDDEDDSSSKINKARSAIIFTSTCEKAARLEALLQQLHIDCVSLHGLLTQDRRVASLGKFKSHQVRILIATDLASRGLDIPEVDLVMNMELPRASEEYIHRVGRTARAGRRGLAVSLVGERDISLVHACEQAAGRPLLKCESVTDAEAIQLLSIVTKATRLANRMLLNTDFPNLVQKRLDRRANDKREYRKAKKGAKERLFQVEHSSSSENNRVK
jgi:ATP-dependent RNA helicase DDX49/DBP8